MSTSSKKSKKSLSLSQNIWKFAEGYSASLGNIPVSQAIEKLIMKGIENVQNQETMHENFMVAIQNLEQKIEKTTNRIIAVNENNTKKIVGGEALNLTILKKLAPKIDEEIFKDKDELLKKSIDNVGAITGFYRNDLETKDN